MSILVIVPSRGRPDACVQLAEEFKRTRTMGRGTHLLFALDNDDPQLDAYEDALECRGLHWVVNPRVRMVPTLNLEAVRHAQYYDVIGFMGDDHRPRTVGWDVCVHERLGVSSAKPGVAYGNDLVHGPSIPTAAFISSWLIERLGYMAPPGLTHMYADDGFKIIGEATELHYMPDVIIEHMHPIVGKAEWSDQYAEVNSFMERDRVEYERWLREDWPNDVKRIHGH